MASRNHHLSRMFLLAAICQPGEEDLDGDGLCDLCQMGFYKEERSEALCLPCPDDYTTADTGATSADTCQRKSGWLVTTVEA